LFGAKVNRHGSPFFIVTGRSCNYSLYIKRRCTARRSSR
jgi:hypothetical protein